MERQDEFLYAYRKDPPAEAVDALWLRLTRHQSPRRRILMFSTPQAAAACLILLILLIFLTSPARIAAQNALRLFVQAARETFSINFSFDETARPQVDFEGISEPSDVDVNVRIGTTQQPVQLQQLYSSLQEAQRRVEDPILFPTQLPDGFSFLGAITRTGSPLVTLVYGRQNAPSLTLHQTRRATDSPTAHVVTSIEGRELLSETLAATFHVDVAFAEIGPGAPVESVPVGDALGEYVHGIWKIEANSLIGNKITAGATVSITPVWDAGATGHLLRWQNGTKFFELIATDAALRKADLIEMAASLQVYSTKQEDH